MAVGFRPSLYPRCFQPGFVVLLSLQKLFRSGEAAVELTPIRRRCLIAVIFGTPKNAGHPSLLLSLLGLAEVPNASPPTPIGGRSAFEPLLAVGGGNVDGAEVHGLLPVHVASTRLPQRN